MALSDLLPNALRAAKPVGGHGDTSPRVSGVADAALTPVPEHYAGEVIPYRGTESHGVDGGHTAYTDPRGELRKSVDVIVAPAEHPPTPVLVKVVKTDGNEVHDWRVVSTVASAVPTTILGRDRRRVSARIINNGAVTVLIGHDQSMTSINSYPLAAGASLTDLRHSEPVWVTSVDGSNVDVRAMIEFRRG